MLNQDQVGGAVRAVLSAIGGYFVGKGTLSADTMTAIMGAVGPVIAVIWTLLANTQTAKVASVNAIDGKAVVDVPTLKDTSK